jgi:peroxiredoxin
MKIKQDQSAPDATLTTLTGEPVSLATYWGRNQAVLVIFLRHLA